MYELNNRKLIEEYSKKTIEKSSALFLGAGFSIESGLPSWKDLLRPFAHEIGIDIDTTSFSLYDIAQFYENSKRASLRDNVKNRINQIPKRNDSLELLTNIPCNSIWTTNYDCYIEDSFKHKGIAPNVISTEKDLTSIRAGQRINVFKLNGDINSFNDSAIITRKDLEQYDKSHALMLAFFKRELITHSFLFLGYSFSDSLVLPCLASIREALGGTEFMPTHYTIIKRDDTPEFEHSIINYEANYNIKSIVVDSYDEIPNILRTISYYSNRKNIFISGAFRSEDMTELEPVSNFCKNLALRISESDYRIINGYGFKIGYYIACALTNDMIQRSYQSFDEKLLMYPFNEHSDNETKTRHREYMISKGNIAIFIFGSDEDDAGMIEEFEIASSRGLAVIPVGTTGYAANKIYNLVRERIIDYPYLEKEIDLLGTLDKSDSKCINAIMKCIDNAIKAQDLSMLKHFS